MKQDEGLSTGLMIGSFAGLTVALLLGAIAFWALGKNVFKDYQALIGAMIASVAALIAIWNVNRQIQNARELAQDQRARKDFAARATLPLTLSYMSTYAEDNIKYLKSIPLPAGLNDPVGPPLSTAHLPSPAMLPEGVISSLKECIEFADKEPRLHLTKLVRRIQIIDSRFNSSIKNLNDTGKYWPVTKEHLIKQIIDFIGFYVTVDLFYGYARFDVETVPEHSVADMPFFIKNKACHLGVTQAVFPDVYTLIESCYNEDESQIV